MQLAEEYLKRHALKVPLVKHVQTCNLFLRGRDDNSPAMLSITYKTDQSSGPGRYAIRHIKPIHDSMNARNMFETVANNNVEWDAYEEYITDLVKSNVRPRALTNQNEVVLCAWEMFLICSDNNLIGYATDEDFFKIIDDNLSTQERFTNYKNFMRKFQKNAALFEVWSRDFLQLVRLSNDWLSNMMDGNGAS